MQRNKAIVGKNAFAHESGIHQHGFLKKKDTFEIMDPKDVGVEDSELVMGKHSGRNALDHTLKNLGYELTQEELDAVFKEFKILADEKKDIFEDDILTLIQKQRWTEEKLNTYRLERITSGFETGAVPEGSVELVSRDGKSHTATAQGRRAGGRDLQRYRQDHRPVLQAARLPGDVQNPRQGRPGRGHRAREPRGGREVLGKGAGVNTVEASGFAYVNAINKLLNKSKSGPVVRRARCPDHDHRRPPERPAVRGP